MRLQLTLVEFMGHKGQVCYICYFLKPVKKWTQWIQKQKKLEKVFPIYIAIMLYNVSQLRQKQKCWYFFCLGGGCVCVCVCVGGGGGGGRGGEAGNFLYMA